MRCINYLIPPIFYVIYKKIRGSYKIKEQNSDVKINLTGPYSSWEDAIKLSNGYDSDLILEKTKNALLKVKTGEVVYERDSVIFDEIQYSWPLLASLMWVAAQSEGRLNVLDFGGSLGSTYFQNKKFLDTLKEIQWNVIEQPKHVKVGKELFENENLHFYPSVDDCIKENTINFIILSGVLQYLENPYEILSTLLNIQCNYIIIDRTPFYDGSDNLLFLQTVPPQIYSASYPCWVFSKKEFLSKLCINKKKVLAEFKSLDNLHNPIHAEWCGMLVVSSELIGMTSQ